MKIVRDPKKLYDQLKKVKKTIGFVPTMGALHAGHLSLIKQAAKENKVLVVSIFVNPTQFGKNEDLKKYPRPLKKDLALCRKNKVDFVFLPSDLTMYPQGYLTYLDVLGLGNKLCGASRVGHFRGVATVVAKLLNVVRPNNLYLGQKDAQQALIVKRMVEDLNFPVKVKVMPTVRESNGLALSSRNIYLNGQQRKEAVVLFKSLQLAKSLIAHGQRDAARIISRIKQLINNKRQAKIDYVSIVDLDKLENLKKIKQGCLIALAVKFGKTRLIDNLLITHV
ncbi:MAG: pantoate--beta-alanine ligase [Candidatus Omnitrophota bacterium]